MKTKQTLKAIFWFCTFFSFYSLHAQQLPDRLTIGDSITIEFMGYSKLDGLPLYYTTDNTIAAKSIGTNKVHPNGSLNLNLSGEGKVVGVWDGGAVRATHQELVARVTQMDGVTALNNHATHVAGTIGASGVYAPAKGMAFDIDIHAYNWENDEAEMTIAAANGLQVSNHSYGLITGWFYNSEEGTWYWYGNVGVSQIEDYKFGFYSSQARDWDEIAYNAPDYLIVKSAGNERNDDGPANGGEHYYWNGFSWTLSTTNRDKDGGIDGYDCIAHAGVSKNVLTVGAVHDIPNAYNQPSDVVMSTFSSWGNTDDGRIKPDIVANGVGLVSPLATTDNQYGISSGTSMSSPSVSGSLILLQEHHENLYGSSMKAATLKGLVIHTADEAGAVEGPDHQFGWGLMNTAKAATVISNNSLPTDSLIEANLSDSDNYTLTVNSDSTSPLVATLSWTDIPGTIPPISLNPTDLILVNDLDMCLTNTATGETFHPYILNPDSPSAPATTGDNFRDNVEKIYLSAPDAGEYTLTISHKNSLANGGQDFSLILSGMSGSDCIIAANFNYSTNDLTVDFTDLSIEGDTYNWNFGDDSSSSEQNPSHIYTEEGTYTVCLTVSNGCGSDTKCEEIVVPPMVNYFCSRWTNYRNSAIRGIAEEGDFLWLATDEGVVKVSTLDTTHTYYNGSNVSLPHNPNNLFTSYNGIYQDIAIDVKGNKWIASTEGVVKFDNTHWILYSQAYSSLFSGVVRTIETDNVGNVWAGTSLGKLLQFDGNNWTEFYSATDIRDIHIEEDGKIWLASFGGGVYHYNGTDWTVYTHDDTALLPSDNRTLSIDKDNLGNTWIGTSTGGLVKFDGTNWTTYTTSNTPELPSNSIGNLYIDSTGGIWMGFSGAKIVQFDGGNNWTVHTMTTTENTFFYYPISIHIDNNDNIWTGALHGRLHKFDSTDFEEYILLFPFGSGESITIDAASGNIWATTSSTNFVNYSSVRMFDGFEWKVYTPFNSNLPTTSRIEHISVATNGNVWGVAFGVGIVRFDGNNWTVYDSSNSPISSSTLGMTLVTDLLGNVWVESANGLAIYDGNSWTTQSNYGNLITDNIGGVWAWSSTQIAKYDGSNWQTYPITVIDGYSLLSAAIKDEHEVWIGTTDGVIKLDAMNDELEAMYNTDNSNLSNDYIYDVEISNDGRVWVGANIDGMFSFDGTNWQSHYNATTTSHGAVNQTYDIVIDANQDIWVANSYAISHYYRGLSSDFIINEAELEVQFHSLEPNAFTYFWNFGDGTTSTDYAPNHVYQNSGTYNVCLTVTNSCENKTTCQAIEVEELIPINYGCSYWVDYTDASIRGIAEEGDFLWLATDEGIIKVNKLDSTALYYNSSNTNLRYNYAGDIAIDSEGNKWIASSTEVVKYDNTTWKRYNSQYSSLLLSASTIETIEVDSEDNIWVGNSIGRLLKFDGNNWTQVYATTGRIEGIHIENDGKIWLASFGGGVHYFDGNTWNVYNHANTPELPSDDRIWKIVKDGLGNIWIGTFTGGLVKFDGTNWLAYTTNNTPELPSNSIGNLDIDSTGDIWMGFSNAKVVQFDGSNNWTVHTMTTTENTFFYHPISIYIDNSDNAWTGVLYGRLHKFDGNDFEEYPLFFPFGSGESITIDDASGNIWATTSSTNFVNYSSVRMFDGFEWKVYTPDNSNLPTTSRIEHINVATNGDVWMTAFGVGVLRFNGTDWTIYDSSNAPVSSTWNGSLLADKAGNIWVNSSVGLAKYDGTNWTSLPNLANLTLDAFGNIWGHTSNQISKYNGNTWQSYDVNNLPSSITSIAIANNDEVWLGTTDGVFKLNIITDEVISYTTDNSNLTNDYIYDVEINEVGQVWIAAHLNGLYRFDGTEWEHHFYPTNNSIEDIEIDANQDLWVAASHNISHFYRKLSADFTVDLNQLEVRFHALEGITTSYSWDFGDGNTSTNYAPLHTYSEEGVYNVCLTVANNCETVENCQEITIDLTCTAIPSFTSPSSTCASESLTFTNTSQNATSYEWFIDNISVSTQTDLTYNFPESGTYEIRLIAFSGDCEDSYTETITITPNANELDLGPDKTICEEGGITTLTANLANMEWYFWDKGGVAMGNTQSIEVSESGIYSLSVTDACINTAIDSIEVLIDDECVWPGDFNYDGIVNNLDLLPLGLAHDATGSLRPNASFEWEGQPCEEWSDLQPDGVNYKHIDGDGNGIIDLNDPQAIQLNYGKTHGNPNNTDSENDPNSDIVVLPVLESENAAFKPEGTPIRIGMHLQKNNNQPLAVYGFAFQIKYTGITVNDVLVDFTNSWMGTPNNDMTYIVKHRPNAKRIDVAITGIDHQNRIGSGEFGMLTIMVDDVLPTDDLLSFGVEMIGSELIDNQGIPTPLGGESEDFVVENQEICPDGIVVEYSNTSDLPLLTWAGGEIFVGNLDGTGNVVIGVGDEVELKAGHTIDIKPGTLVEMGAVLTVEIEECQEADNSPGKRGDDRQPQPPVGKEIELLIHPNPITDYTHIAYELPEDTKVSLYIVDKTGRRVQSLIQTKSQKAGEYRVTFEACAARMPAGIYYAVLETPFGLKTVKLVKTQ